MPEKKARSAAITTKPQTISVGKFGTNPVFMYSIRIGIKKTKAIVNKIIKRALKNNKGL